MSIPLDSKKLPPHIWFMSNGLNKAIEKAGGLRALARILNLRHQSIMQWDEIPARHIIPIEKATGIPREELRPDLYSREDAE